jgi:hypothetical protein
LYRQRVLVRTLIAVAGAAVVLFTRPLTPGLIIWTAVVCVVLVAILEVLQRPPASAPAFDLRT